MATRALTGNVEDLLSLAGVFAIAFVAATILPAQSEAALVGLLVLGKQPPVLLVIVATIVLIAINVAARTPWPLVLYGILVTATIVLSSGLMMSRARLLLPAFVLHMPIANVLARQTPPVRNTVLACVIALSSWFGAHMLTVYPHAM